MYIFFTHSSPFSTIQNVSTKLAFPKRIDLISGQYDPGRKSVEQLVIERRPLILYLYVITNLLFHLVLFCQKLKPGISIDNKISITAGVSNIMAVVNPTNFRRIFSSTPIYGPAPSQTI